MLKCQPSLKLNFTEKCFYHQRSLCHFGSSREANNCILCVFPFGIKIGKGNYDFRVHKAENRLRWDPFQRCFCRTMKHAFMKVAARIKHFSGRRYTTNPFTEYTVLQRVFHYKTTGNSNSFSARKGRLCVILLWIELLKGDNMVIQLCWKKGKGNQLITASWKMANNQGNTKIHLITSHPVTQPL